MVRHISVRIQSELGLTISNLNNDEVLVCKDLTQRLESPPHLEAQRADGGLHKSRVICLALAKSPAIQLVSLRGFWGDGQSALERDVPGCNIELVRLFERHKASYRELDAHVAIDIHSLYVPD